MDHRPAEKATTPETASQQRSEGKNQLPVAALFKAKAPQRNRRLTAARSIGRAAAQHAAPTAAQRPRMGVTRAVASEDVEQPERIAPDERVRCWIETQLDVTIETSAPLVGGVTADMDRFTVRSPNGSTNDVVLRRWTNPEWWTDGMVEREATVLTALTGHDIPAPGLIASDTAGASTGVRCLLMTALPGEPELAPADRDDWLRQLATLQSRIHALPLPPLAATGRNPEPDKPHWLGDAALRAQVYTAGRDADPTHDLVFSHGDFQHFNVLWRDGRLTGIVDWPLGGTGPRAADVGHCLLNLAILFDADTADAYNGHYEQAARTTVDPRGILCALLEANPGWREFLPRQVAGRAPLELDGFLDRVADLMRRWVSRLS